MNRPPFYDYLAFKEWVYKSYSLGLKNTYLDLPQTKILNNNQPPGTIYVLRGSYEVFLVTARILTHFMHLKPGATLWINDNLLVFFLRLPSILTDLILGAAIYLFLKSKTNERLALISSALYLFSPAILFNSTVWGQLDSINTALFFVSLIFLLRKQAFLSLFFFMLSLLTKFTLLPLMPIYFIFAAFGGYLKQKSFIKSLLFSLIAVWIFCLPFSANPFWIMDFAIKSTAGISDNVSVNAFNFWWFIFDPTLSIHPSPRIISMFLGISLSLWAYALFFLIYVPVFLCSVKLVKTNKLTDDRLFLIFGVVAFASFMFLPKMHERYLYPALPFLITWVALKNKYWITTIMLNLLHFLNLYIVWNAGLYLFGPWEDIIKTQIVAWIISLLTIIIFCRYYLAVFTNHYFPIRTLPNRIKGLFVYL